MTVSRNTQSIRQRYQTISVTAPFALSPAGLAIHPGPLPDLISTPSSGHSIQYTSANPQTPLTSPTTDKNHFPAAQVRHLANILDNGSTATHGKDSFGNRYADPNHDGWINTATFSLFKRLSNRPPGP